MSVTMNKREVSSSFVLSSVFVVIVLGFLGRGFFFLFYLNGLVLFLDVWGSVYSWGGGGGVCRVIMVGRSDCLKEGVKDGIGMYRLGGSLR